MDITVNETLTKSRNPHELHYTLTGKKGKVIHSLEDGYWLIEFKDLLVKEKMKINNKTTWQFMPLHWYIHRDDLSVIK